MLTCSNSEEGCSELFDEEYDRVKHIKYCSYRKKHCPFCSTVYLARFLKNHCKWQHRSFRLKLKEEFEFDHRTIMTIPTYAWMTHNARFYIISYRVMNYKGRKVFGWRFDKLNLKIPVKETKILQWQLSFKGHKGFKKQNFDIGTFTAMSLELLFKVVYSPSIIVAAFRTSNLLNDINCTYRDPNLLSKLTCDKCSSIILPPIYNMSNNMLFCFGCMTATNSIEGLNVTLNRVAKLLLYSCKNEKFGCDFKSLYDLIQIHHPECSYNTVDCVFKKCFWKNQLNQLNDHIFQEHLVPSDDCGTYSYRVRFSEAQTIIAFWSVVKINQHFFFLQYTVFRNKFYCFLQKADVNDQTFKYQITFFDPLSILAPLQIHNSYYCLDFNTIEKFEDFVSCETICVISRDYLEKFLKRGDDEVLFTVKISQDCI